MSLPAAKDLRARADRVIERATLGGTPRSRFLREAQRRLGARLLPLLAAFALSTGLAALTDLLRSPPSPAAVTVAQGLTAIALSAIAIAVASAQRRPGGLATLMSLGLGGALTTILGWAFVTAQTGGVHSPYVHSVPIALATIVLVIPFLPLHLPLLAAFGGVAFYLAAPGAPLPTFALFALLSLGSWALARSRRRRGLRAFRRLERLSASVARIRQVQDQLVVVEKLEALRVLVGGMAHELNNALAVSIASMEQVARAIDPDPESAAKATARAQKGLQRIRGTIDRLKRFAMAEAGILEAADLCAMLDFALESAIGRARSGVAVDRRYEDDLPPVDVHVAGLAEALFQVARNAVEAMPQGGTIRASVRRSGDDLVLAVADQGQGIPGGRLAKIFDPYYARDALDTFSGGRVLAPVPGRSGMGLSAVYGIVSSLGGKLDIQSEVGKGTEVSITLPAARLRESARMSSRPPPAVAVRGSWPPQRPK